MKYWHAVARRNLKLITLKAEMHANSNLFSRHVLIGNDDGDLNEIGKKEIGLGMFRLAK